MFPKTDSFLVCKFKEFQLGTILCVVIFVLTLPINLFSFFKNDEPPTIELIQNIDSLEAYLNQLSSIEESKQMSYLITAFESAKELESNRICCQSALAMKNYNYDSQVMLAKYKYVNETVRNGFCEEMIDKARIYNALGNSFYDFGKYEQALQAFFSSAKYYKAINDNNINIPLGNVSEVYLNSGKLEEAISYTHEALVYSNLLESPDKELSLTYDYYRLATMHLELGDFPKSEDYIKLAIENVAKLDVEEFSLEYFDTYTTAIKLYLKKGNKVKAKQYLLEAKKVVQDYNVETLKFYEAKVAHELINYDKAFRLINSINVDEIQLYADKINFLEFKKSILIQIANYDVALKVSEQMRTMEKENFNRNSARTFALADVEYEIQKNKQEVQTLSKQREVDQVTIKKQRLSSSFIILFSILLMSFVISLFIQNKRKKQTIEAQIILEEELRSKSDEIEKSRQVALSASQAKQDFLSTMSHEIRTPMNAVLGLTNLLLDEMPRDDQKKHLSNIKFSGENLLSIINDVLDFSKIESGKITFSSDEFDLKTLLNNTIDAVRYSRKKNELEIFQKQKLNTIKTLVIGDRTRLNQILINILGNAIKFTEEGYVSLETCVLEETDSDIRVEFKIRDTGIGIPSEKIDNIFDSFIQLENKIQGSLKGTGLGLAITKKLIEKQGGSIQVESKENMGTMFTFRLPFKKGQVMSQSTIASSDGQIYRQGLEGLKILLVEDNHINQIVAVNTLKKLKVKPMVANNGVEAMTFLETESFDLILMDIQMPLMNGIETTINIRNLKNKAKAEIPIIALSADAYSNNVKEALDAGMNAYLTKPFKPKDLYEAIRDNLAENQPRPGSA